MIKILNRAKPYLKNCFSYGTLFCGAELAQQFYIRKYQPSSEGLQTEKLDGTKLLHLSGWGYAIAPSYMALWYSWLDTRYVARSPRIILIKVLLDQTLLTIPLLLGFFPYMSWCQDQEDVLRELKEKFWTTYALSCAWFLPAQTINFLFIPPQYRILYNGVCGFIWANVLCAVKRSGE